MLRKSLLILAAALLVKADFQNQFQQQGQSLGGIGQPIGGFSPLGGIGGLGQPLGGIGQPLGGGIVPLNTNSLLNQQSLFQKQSQAAGTAAGAGTAQAGGQGSATSINQANQQAANGQTSAQGLSANTAQGTQGAQAGGAAQAGGQVQEQAAKQDQQVAAMQNQFAALTGRRKRDEEFAFKDLQQLADSSALGGGNVKKGKIGTKNSGFSKTDRLSSTSQAGSSAFGEGEDLNLFDVANTHASSRFRFRRDLERELKEMADGGARGGGSVDLGEIETSNRGFSKTDRNSAMGFGAGSASGRGRNLKLCDIASSHALSSLRDVNDDDREKRDVDFSDLVSSGDSKAFGKGSVDLGSLDVEDSALSFSKPDRAMSRGSSKMSGKGQKLELEDVVNTHAQTVGRFRV